MKINLKHMKSFTGLQMKNDKVTEEVDPIRKKLLGVLVVGIFIRLVIMSYTAHPGTWEHIMVNAYQFYLGLPTSYIIDIGFGTTTRLFEVAVQIPNMALDYFGVRYTFISEVLFKIPGLLGDVIIFYALYNISKLVAGDKKRSLIVASAYFLNPMSIFVSSIIGHSEGLLAAFVLLSLLYLLRRQMFRSGACLGLAVFTRWFPVLLLPCFLVYLFMKNQRGNTIRFVEGFAVASLFLAVPYACVALKAYLASPALFWRYIGHFTGSFSLAVTGEIPLPLGFPNNLTGFLAAVGVWQQVNVFFDQKIFVVLFFISIFIVLRKKSASFNSLVKCVILLCSLFLLIRPLYFQNYFMWVLPFIILESFIFREIPKYYIYALSFSVLVASFFFDGKATYNFYLCNSVLPQLIDWSLGRAISVLHAFFLISIVILCLFPHHPVKISNPDKRIFNKKVERSLILLFLIYYLTEIFGVALASNAFIRFILSFFMLFCSFVLVWTLLNRRGYLATFSKLLSSNLSRIIASFYIVIISTIAFISITFHLDSSLFLVTQVVIIGGFWVINRTFSFGLHLQTLSLAFTLMYLAYIVQLIHNFPLMILFTLFSASWILLQVLVYAPLAHTQSKMRQPEKNQVRLGIPRINTGYLLQVRLGIPRINKGYLLKVRLRIPRINTGYLLLGMFIFSYVPLIWAISTEVHPHTVNAIEYWAFKPSFPGEYDSSHGAIEWHGGNISVGDIEYDGKSWVAWKMYPWFYPFITDQLRQVGRADLYVEGRPPTSCFQIPLEQHDGWIDNAFENGWALTTEGGAEGTTIWNSDGNIACIESELEQGSYASAYIGKQVPHLNTTEYPYLFARVKLSWPEIDVSNYIIQVVYDDGTNDYWADHWTNPKMRTVDWAVVTWKLNPNKSIQEVRLGVENNRAGAWTGGGLCKVYYDFIAISSTRPTVPHIQVKNNDQVIDLAMNTSILEKTEYGDLTDPLNPWFKFTFSIDSLEAENYINITVDRYTQWEIKSVYIRIWCWLPYINTPFWRLYAPQIIVATFLETIILLIIFNKLRKWAQQA